MALKILAQLGRSATRRSRNIDSLQLLATWPQRIDHQHALSSHSQAATEVPSLNTTAFQAASYGVAARAEEHLQNFYETYRVSVVTGNVRGAGTSAAAYIQLIGTHGESDKVIIGNSDEEGLQRGSKVTFTVPVPGGIGPLRRINVERSSGGHTTTGDGWYLDTVVVQGPDGEVCSFPCQAWFGHSDSGDYEGEQCNSSKEEQQHSVTMGMGRCRMIDTMMDALHKSYLQAVQSAVPAPNNMMHARVQISCVTSTRWQQPQLYCTLSACLAYYSQLQLYLVMF